MDGGKRSVNSSSLIDLKAELFRKQEEFKKQKLTSENAKYIKGKTTEKKPNIFSRKNRGVLEREQNDRVITPEQEDELEKSKRSLEAKAKLYEAITQGSTIPEEDGSGQYLVDFQKKVIDDIVEKREQQRIAEAKASVDEPKYLTEEDVPPPSCPEEEWMDYVDSFGRSRRCMRKDLPEAGLIKNKNTTPDQQTNDPALPDLLSSDMRREMLRQKWEQEEQDALNGPVGPVHYANVQKDEIREHGVGFYQFDKSETTRQEQLDSLSKLRQQTIDERDKKDRLKEKRKAMMAARLSKVKQRKRLRHGGPEMEDDEVEVKEEEAVSAKIDTMTEQPSAISEDKRVANNAWKKPTVTREWDTGKQGLFDKTGEAYVEKRREERVHEFAPPTDLYNYPSPNKQAFGKKAAKMLWQKPRKSNDTTEQSDICTTDESPSRYTTDEPPSRFNVDDENTVKESVGSSRHFDENATNRRHFDENATNQQRLIPPVSAPYDSSVPPPGYRLSAPASMVTDVSVPPPAAMMFDVSMPPPGFNVPYTSTEASIINNEAVPADGITVPDPNSDVYSNYHNANLSQDASSMAAQIGHHMTGFAPDTLTSQTNTFTTSVPQNMSSDTYMSYQGMTDTVLPDQRFTTDPVLPDHKFTTDPEVPSFIIDSSAQETITLVDTRFIQNKEVL